MENPGQFLLEIVLSKNHKKKVAEMNIHPQILEAAAISLQVLIVALGYIFTDLSMLKLRKKLKVNLRKSASGSGSLLLNHSLDSSL
jgi:hypothetical protein